MVVFDDVIGMEPFCLSSWGSDHGPTCSDPDWKSLLKGPGSLDSFDPAASYRYIYKFAYKVIFLSIYPLLYLFWSLFRV